MEKMYPPVVNSPKTELTELITETQTEIAVANASVLLQGEGIAVLGNGDAAETITYTTVEENVLKGCVRGFEGVARAWPVGTRIARNFTAADWRAAIKNIQALHDESSSESRKPITLQPGVQIVKTDKQTVFNLAGLTGKTVIDYEGQKGLFGVRNPYAIRYGENLLPSFYEWSATAQAGTATITGPNQITLSKSAGLSGFNTQAYNVNAVPATDYTLSVTVDVSNIGGTIGSGAYWNLQAMGKNGEVLADFTAGPFATSNGTKTMVKSFTTPANTSYLRVIVGLDIAATGTAVFRDVSINIGSTAKPFKPREDSMLALQTDLYADPVTGENADTVFERDGQYFKSKKFESVLLDGGKISKVNGVQQRAGFKILYPAVDNISYDFGGYRLGVKFDGKTLGTGQDAADKWDIDSTSKNFAVSVSVADSGWDDGYMPSLDDIKAYFFGYKAYDANTITPANAQAMTTATWTGTGTKYWVQRAGAPNFTQSVPQQSYAGYTPYQLVYQLATPTVEPIVSEGQLTFTEGDNQVEVGTGIVLRERSGINTMPGVYAYINAEFPLKYKPRNILGVYKNGKKDSRWEVIIRPGSDVFAPIGIAFARLVEGRYDPADSFSTTYLMTDTSPVVPFTGSYAANEKTLLADLVDSVQQNTARLSVVENKKAEKDSPAWITPTLFNGWTPFDDQSGMGYRTAQYYKDSSNRVHVRGLIKNGTKTAGTVLFKLPQGYRPSFAETFIVAMSYTNTSITYYTRVTVLRTGDAILANELTGGTDPYWIQLFGISFLAEQ